MIGSWEPAREFSSDDRLAPVDSNDAHDLPAVRQALAAGYELLSEAPFCCFLPAVWPEHARAWTRDDRVRRSFRGTGETPLWSTADHVEMAADDARTLAEGGVAPGPPGRVWLLRPPQGRTVEELFHEICEAWAARGGQAVPTPGFVLFARDQIAAAFGVPPDADLPDAGTAVPAAHQGRVGAGAVVVRDGRVLIGRRVKLDEPPTWCLPGGHVEPGETFEQAALRELAEETGLRSGRAARVFAVVVDLMPDRANATAGVLVEVDGNEQPRTTEPDKLGHWTWADPAALPRPLFPATSAVLAAWLGGELPPGWASYPIVPR